MTSTELQELLRVAESVAADAARVLVKGYRSRPVATEKARSDLVTDFDLASESLIRDRLGAETPGVAVVAEERGGTPSGLTWYVDPLDGTTNFVHGHPFFCVSIGLLEGPAPAGGVVVAPVLGLTFSGGAGIGAFRNGKPCAVSAESDLSRSLLATGFPPNRDRADFATFERVKRRAQGIRRCGSAALDCCLVADGTYDGYWESALHVWDIAAGAAIALGAGARLSSLDGTPPNLTEGNLVLTNGRIHDALVALVRH